MDIGFHFLIRSEQQEIVLVQVELLVTQGGLFGHEMHTQTTIHHLCLGTESCTQHVGGIIVTYADGATAFLQDTIEEGIKHELRILLVVTYLTTEREAFLALRQSEINSIQAHATHRQRMKIAVTIQTFLGRRVHIKPQFLEVYAITTLQQVGQRIVALTLDMHLQSRQQFSQRRLVDGLPIDLRHHRITKYTECLRHLLVVAAGINLHNEVTTLCTDYRRIGIGFEQQSYPLCTIGLGGIGHHNITDQSCDVVLHLHIGIDIG